ncbi:MAG TPA: bifunctional ADP-heptose synthase [Saprospiraceae bacterium]|nr:bifunctional ADP-heptose synthase [Saprospiraceae bacterium]
MITKEDLQKVRNKAASINALVIGDAMLDRYIIGVVERISPEAPVPILTHHSTETRAGGAANVAINLSSWGCHTSLVGMIGNDMNGNELKDILDQNKIQHHLYISNTRVTTVKTRVVAASHHLLRIDEESSDYLSGDEESNFIQHLENILSVKKPDLIIIEDYNKGVLTEKIIAWIIDYSKRNNVFLAIDPKEKHFLNYQEANLFKPNLREAAHAAHKNLMIEDLKELSAEWRNNKAFDTIAITLGGQGVFLHNQESTEIVKPLHSIDVVDVCGAGDAVICALALAQLSGLDLKKSGELANLTGAYVCSHSGVVSVDPVEIENWI